MSDFYSSDSDQESNATLDSLESCLSSNNLSKFKFLIENHAEIGSLLTQSSDMLDGIDLMTLVCSLCGHAEGERDGKDLGALDVQEISGDEEGQKPPLHIFCEYLLDLGCNVTPDSIANLVRRCSNITLIERFFHQMHTHNTKSHFDMSEDQLKVFELQEEDASLIVHNAVRHCASSADYRSIKDRLAVILYLKKNQGLDLHMVDGFGGNALFYALEDAATFNYLLETEKLDWTLKNMSGRTLLHEVVSYDVYFNDDVVKKILNLGDGAWVNQQDENGVTPLMLCAQSGSEEIARMLLEHGADVSMKDHAGEDAFDFNQGGLFDLASLVDKVGR